MGAIAASRAEFLDQLTTVIEPSSSKTMGIRGHLVSHCSITELSLRKICSSARYPYQCVGSIDEVDDSFCEPSDLL